MQGALFDVSTESEREFQSKFQRALDHYGWHWVFVRKMRTPDGRYLTGTSKPGWPDICALKPGFVLVSEQKRTPKQKPTETQLEWLEWWLASGALAWVLRPTDNRKTIARWLDDPANAPSRFGW